MQEQIEEEIKAVADFLGVVVGNIQIDYTPNTKNWHTTGFVNEEPCYFPKINESDNVRKLIVQCMVKFM